MPGRPSAPFVSRELNGEVLLDELVDLKLGQLPLKALHELVLELRTLEAAPVAVAVQRLRQLAAQRQASHPQLAQVLTRWAPKVKADADVTALIGHFERLAVVGAVVSVVKTQKPGGR